MTPCAQRGDDCRNEQEERARKRAERDRRGTLAEAHAARGHLHVEGVVPRRRGRPGVGHDGRRALRHALQGGVGREYACRVMPGGEGVRGPRERPAGMILRNYVSACKRTDILLSFRK